MNKLTVAEKKQIMDGAHLKNELSHWNIYSGSFIQVESTAKKIDDVVEQEEAYKRADLWSKEDIALFLRKYMMYPKEFDTIKSFFYNKRMKDIILFYYTFKNRFKLVDHLKEISSCSGKASSGSNSKRSTRTRDAYIEETISKIIHTLDTHNKNHQPDKLEFFSIGELQEIYGRAMELKAPPSALTKRNLKEEVKPVPKKGTYEF